MKRLLSSVLICAAPLSLALPAPASAQIAVYDPVNHVQNILQGIRTLQEINQQIQQLTHEIETLENMKPCPSMSPKRSSPTVSGASTS